MGGRKVLSFLWPLLVADCEWDVDLSKTYLVEQQGVDQRVPEEGDSLNFLWRITEAGETMDSAESCYW